MKRQHLKGRKHPAGLAFISAICKKLLHLMRKSLSMRKWAAMELVELRWWDFNWVFYLLERDDGDDDDDDNNKITQGCTSSPEVVSVLCSQFSFPCYPAYIVWWGRSCVPAGLCSLCTGRPQPCANWRIIRQSPAERFLRGKGQKRQRASSVYWLMLEQAILKAIFRLIKFMLFVVMCPLIFFLQ